MPHTATSECRIGSQPCQNVRAPWAHLLEAPGTSPLVWQKVVLSPVASSVVLHAPFSLFGFRILTGKQGRTSYDTSSPVPFPSSELTIPL